MIMGSNSRGASTTCLTYSFTRGVTITTASSAVDPMVTMRQKRRSDARSSNRRKRAITVSGIAI
ncbi:uncharacterized protein METZ01_LOCUS458204, partial [marine metagenome]